MDPWLKALLAALGMPETASQDDILKHCTALFGGYKAALKALGIAETTPPADVATAAQSAIGALATALKAPADANIAGLATAAQQLVAGAGQVDLTKYVPKELYAATAAQLTELQGKVSKSGAERAVEDAIKAGKLTPALKDWGMATASQNLADFQAWVEKAPVLVATAAQQPAPGAVAPAPGQQQLTADELAMCSQLGITAEDFKKSKEGK